ncbi:MAG: hypothetical protein WCK42_06625 [Myxococcaceae bacterium]
MPITGLVQRDYQNALDAHQRHVTLADVGLMIADAKKENKSQSSGGCCSSEGTIGTEEFDAVFSQHMDDFEPEAKRAAAHWLSSQGMRHANMIDASNPLDSVGKVLVNMTARATTWLCDWFPTTFRPNAPASSLFTPGGVCDKLDQATGKASRAYELKNHETHGIAWGGHCDMASRVCCLLKQPVRDVVHNGVKFTPHDIQGLLVMVSNDLAADNEPFIGQRNNGNPGDDPAEPRPQVLMPKLMEWAKAGYSYVLDIDNSTEVWNYAFDSTKIQEFNSPQDGMRRMTGESGGQIKYQTWHLSGTGYDAEIRNYKSWTEYDDNGKILSSGWFGAASDHKRNPDFAWRPIPCGDLTNRSAWPATCVYNPEVDPRVVFDIYTQSI